MSHVFSPDVRTVDLAAEYVQSQHGSNGCFEWRGHLWVWAEGSWQRWSDKRLANAVTSWLAACTCEQTITKGTKVQTSTFPFPFSEATVRDVVAMVKRRHWQPDEQMAPMWLGGGDAPCDPLWAVGFSDCVVDARTLTSYDKGRDWFMPHAHPFGWSPDATCPRWLQALADWFPDAADRERIRRRMGYLMVGYRGYAAIFVDVGKPRAGKSTIDAVEGWLVGHEYKASLDVTRLQHAHGLENLQCARYIVCPELDKGGDGPLNYRLQHFAKCVVGRDMTSVNPKGQPIFNCTLDACIKFVGNALPAIEDQMGSFWNKVVLTWYGQSYLGKEDHDLLDSLKVELPGIVAWALEGAHQLYEAPSAGKWPKSQASNDLWMQAVAQGKPVTMWLQQRCVQLEGRKLDKARAYEDFRQWAASHEIKGVPTTQAAFTKLVVGGPWAVSEGWDRDAEGRNHRVFVGLRLK